MNISIIATVRNEENVISEFVKSLLNQTLQPDEIIIVDGESTDNTLNILKDFTQNNSITVISQNCNIAEGRNLGIQSAKNDFIAITDAGCNVDKDWLKEIATVFNSTEKPDVVAGNFEFDCHSFFEEAVVLSTFNPDREQSESARYFPSSRSLALKKSAWKEAKGYPEWLYAAEDTLFNIRLRQLGFKFVFAKKAIVRWRPRETWKALAKQRYNFSRGNARVGIGTQGYIINLKYHFFIFLPLLLSVIWPWAWVISIYPAVSHIKNNLWSQSNRAQEKSNKPFMKYWVLLVMEYTRIVGMIGFLRGCLDRLIDKSYVMNQQKWMGIKTLDDLVK